MPYFFHVIMNANVSVALDVLFPAPQVFFERRRLALGTLIISLYYASLLVGELPPGSFFRSRRIDSPAFLEGPELIHGLKLVLMCRGLVALRRVIEIYARLPRTA